MTAFREAWENDGSLVRDKLECRGEFQVLSTNENLTDQGVVFPVPAIRKTFCPRVPERGNVSIFDTEPSRPAQVQMLLRRPVYDFC